MSRAISSLTAVATAAMLAGTPAAAGDLSALGISLDTWQIGGFVFIAPKYEGSKDYRVLGAPFIAPGGFGEGEGRLAIKATDDVRLRLFSASGFEIGPVAGWRFGRDEEDGDRLRGLGDVDGGLVIGAYAAYRMGAWSAAISYGEQVTGDEAGGLIRLGLEQKTKLMPWLTLTASLGTTYASDEYMDAYFSVSQLQSARSGLRRFDAEAGIKDVNAGLVADITLDPRWSLKLMGKYSHLVGDAADSPVVETESQFSGGLGLTYKFTVGK